MRCRALPLMLATLWFASAPGVRAETPRAVQAKTETQTPLILALIVGVNRPAEPGLAPLRFADDDALKYQALLGALGAYTITLTETDESSRRLYANAAMAKAPTRAELDSAASDLKARVAQAHSQGRTVTVYFVYAGHGARDKETSEGFLTLSDARLSAPALFAAVVDKIGADTFHFIVDACNSQFLAETRGPGGIHRPLSPLAHDVARQALDRRVGLLFATSSMTKTFEYEGFQGGVFSHLVRSGLHGAADFDLNGLVSYEELQRFVARAAAPIINDLYRPRVQALPPSHTETLADLRGSLTNSIVVTGDEPPAHHVVEDRNGVRILDFHNASGETLQLVWPSGTSPLFVFVEDGSHEVQLSPSTQPVMLAKLQPRPRRAETRGAADHAFRSLFTLPFSAQSVAAIDLEHQKVDLASKVLPTDNGRKNQARVAFWAAGAATLVGLVARGAAELTLNSETPKTNQADIDTLNKRARLLEWVAGISLGVAAGSAITGWVLLAMPTADDNAQVSGASISLFTQW